MTEENHGSVWTIDHCYPLSKTDISNKTDKIKTTYWFYLRPRYYNKNTSKGSKIDNRIYFFYQVKTNFFSKLNAQEV